MHQIFWDQFGVEIFKMSQSIPGVCMSYLFDQLHKLKPTLTFGLFGEKQGELCQELYASMTGGLSSIVTRLAEHGKTKIRGGDKVVKKVVGYE
jgi:hypothetical protein